MSYTTQHLMASYIGYKTIPMKKLSVYIPIACSAMFALASCANKCDNIDIRDSSYYDGQTITHPDDGPTNQGGGMPDSNAVRMTESVAPLTPATGNSHVDTQSYHESK